MRPETDPDASWVQALSDRPLPAVQDALREAGSQRRLYSYLARQHRLEHRDSYVEIDAPWELHALVRLLRPSHVVEVGVSSGVSSAYLLNALALNRTGILHSIDLPSHPTRKQISQGSVRGSWTLPLGRSTGWAVPPGLRHRWDLRLGDKAEVLPMLSDQIPEVDLFVYDVPHWDATTRKELRTLDDHFPSGSVVIIDHGPGGGLCDALRAWARGRGAVPAGRTGLGLYGARARA
jgi:hypothetical protein